VSIRHYEANFDGLVGPTHNYAGLSFGNVASLTNAKASSSPRAAAKQGLAKMKALHDMGMVQGVFAPQQRPDLNTLRRLGFAGSDARVLEQAAQQAPAIFHAVCSASSMWTANAATVSPGADSADGKVHFTPANLTNKFHRSIEAETSGRILQAMFDNSKYFAHHRHLPDNEHFADEGDGEPYPVSAVIMAMLVSKVFTFGRYAFASGKPAPQQYPARQTFEASQAIARLHGLTDDNTVYIQQNPEVIDQGGFSQRCDCRG